jgi:hypothetical protein
MAWLCGAEGVWPLVRMVWTCYREAQRKVFFGGAAEAAAALNNQGTFQ